METTPTTAPAFVAAFAVARTWTLGPHHAVRNVPSQFTDVFPSSNPRRFTHLRAACGVGVYGLWIGQTEAGETVPWGQQSLTRDCPACVRRVKALYRDGLVR